MRLNWIACVSYGVAVLFVVGISVGYPTTVSAVAAFWLLFLALRTVRTLTEATGELPEHPRARIVKFHGRPRIVTRHSAPRDAA